ncbi:MAG: hypothetical protein IJO06_13475 [Thermoguttaceae bacterium]|nr:hypothetical protein [Thermoguttaceae bacterium]
MKENEEKKTETPKLKRYRLTVKRTYISCCPEVEVENVDDIYDAYFDGDEYYDVNDCFDLEEEEIIDYEEIEELK